MPLPSTHPYYNFSPPQVSSEPLPSTLDAPYTIANAIPIWFRGDQGLTTTTWSNYGSAGGNLSNTGTIVLSNYSQVGGTQTGGTNNCCTLSRTAYWNFTNVPSFANDYRSVFAVYKIGGTFGSAAAYNIFGSAPAGRGYGMQYFISNTGTQYADFFLSTGSFLPIYGYYTVPNPTTKFYLHSMVWGSTAAASYIKVGPTTVTPSNWSTAYGWGFYTPLYLGFGSNPTQTAGATMTICEFLMIDGTMTSTDTAKIESWLNTRWAANVA